MDCHTIEQLINEGLPGADARVSSTDNVHFEAVVSFSGFQGKSPLQRHRMIYATLGDLLGGEIHALSIQTSVPEL